MPKVLIAPMTLAGLNISFVDVLTEAGFELVYPAPGRKLNDVTRQLNEEELMHSLQGIDASLAGSEPYTHRVFAANPQLKVVARVGVGYDAVDVEAATEHGVVVTITPGANHDSVAEHAFTLMLALVKDLVYQHNALVTGAWPRKTNLPLRGQTLGIAGLGRIGKAIALRSECFGMNLIAYDPFPDEAFARAHGIRWVTFDQLLAESDMVTLHLPYTKESKHLINKTTLAKMKPTAFLINTARGGLVCEADLYDALKNKRLAGAGLDVFEEEPPGKIPLFELSNVVVTPHNAGTDVKGRNDMAESAARAIVALTRGEWPAEKIVNPQVRGRR
jgi:D-3-phosphoglycerate dehydrogenase / 2-oxoglutarate reductase